MIKHSVLLRSNIPHTPCSFNNNVSKDLFDTFLDLQIKFSQFIPDPVTKGIYLQHKKFSCKIQKSSHTEGSHANTSVHWAYPLFLHRTEYNSGEGGRETERGMQWCPTGPSSPWASWWRASPVILLGVPPTQSQVVHIYDTYPWSDLCLTKDKCMSSCFLSHTLL